MEILSLGEKIKRKRKELNMTLKDLAKDRITPGQISLVESGRSNPSMDLLEYLASSLNITVEYLMESEETQAEKVCTYYEQMAESYILDNNYSKGEEYIEEALKYAERYNLEYKKGNVLYLRGSLYKKQGDLLLSQQYLLSANVIFIKLNRYKEIIKTFLDLGKITLELKSYYSANSYLKQAEKVFLDNELEEDYLLGEIYFNLAKTYFEIENIGRAMEYAILTKEQFEKLNEKEVYARNLRLLSEEYGEKGDLEKAIKYSKKSLEIFSEVNDFSKISNMENDLGKLFYNFENIEESFKRYEIAKNMRVQNNKESEIIDTLINICRNYLKVKDLKRCQSLLDEIYEKLDDTLVNEKIECNLIKYRMYIINDQKIDGEQMLLETYKFAKARGLYQKAGELAIMMGKFYIDIKNEESATRYLNEGVELFKEIGIINN